jgi:glycosyltransferase involved in cell wall biosynthesis
VVVDDGSTDTTSEIMSRFAREDPKIRCVSKANEGLAKTRNFGATFSNSEWLSFLDADDLVDPDYVEVMGGHANAAHPDVGLVHCGFRRLLPDGETEKGSINPGCELFALLTNYCCFGHTAQCLVRSSLFRRLDGFDPLFNPSEDWDMWLRIARMGVRNATVNRFLTYYRMRSASMSRNPSKTLIGGWKVIKIGHSADPRVSAPLPAYAQGRPKTELNSKLLCWLFWVAGIAIGSRTSPDELLSFEISTPTHIDYAELKLRLIYGLAHGSCSLYDESLITRFFDPIGDFLRALELKMTIPRFATNFLGRADLMRVREAVPLPEKAG